MRRVSRKPQWARRDSGASVAVILVVIVLVSVLGTSLVSLTVDMGAVQPATLDSATAFYAAESGLAVANVQGAATAGPMSFAGVSWETTKTGAGDPYTYTTTVSKGGQVLRVIQSDIAEPVDDNPGGPLDEEASGTTATTGAFEDPVAGWVVGDDKKLVFKLINPTNEDLQVVAFSLMTTGTQPKVKSLKFSTAANGWNNEEVWKQGSGVDVPTGRLDFNDGDPVDDWTIPANSYIIVDTIEFKDDVDPYTDLTFTAYFSDGSSSDVAYTVLSGDDIPANPLDESASQATFTQGSFSDPHAGTVSGDSKKVVGKFINETDKNLTVEGFSLSCTTSQPKVKEIKVRCERNQWNATKVWDEGSGVDLPTGDLVWDEGSPAEDHVIPVGGYMIVDPLGFKGDLNAGTFTLTINFLGGASSVITFTLP